MSDPILTTGEYIVTVITGGVSLVGIASATLHKLGIVTIRSPLKLKRNGRGEAASPGNPGNPAPLDIPKWCADIRQSCMDSQNVHFTAINTALGRIEKKQGEQVGVLGTLKGEVVQLVSAYRESNGHAGIVVENLKGRVFDLEKEKDGYTDK